MRAKMHEPTVHRHSPSNIQGLTLSNLPTEAIMLQSGETLQQLIQSLWPESTCTLLPATDRGGEKNYNPTHECLFVLNFCPETEGFTPGGGGGHGA